MTTQGKSEYIHGTDPDEQQRLSRLNDFLNEGSFRELHLQGKEKILDVGCGLAQFSRSMARAVHPEGRVVGIDRSSEQLNEARRLSAEAGEQNLVDLRQGDASDFPLTQEEWGSFDLAHTRFLLEHLTNPLQVVQSMVRAVRPSGRIILEDDDHDILRFWPDVPGFLTIWNAYIRSYDRLGNDPFVGRRLVSLLHEAGAKPVRNTWIFFGTCAGNPDFELLVNNILGIMNGAKEEILETSHLPAEYFQEALKNLQVWGKRPDAAIWFALCWAEGIKPDEAETQA
jgi:SAM-dependent methyltransferase